MNINRENYEAYFLDYHEGNLTDQQVKELMDFLMAHPDLKSEFDSFDMISLEIDDSIRFARKESLRKSEETLPLPDQKMIAYYEGDLDKEQSAAFIRELAGSSEARKDFELYGKLHLQPDTSIVFPKKSSLKKFTLGSYMPAIRHYAAAAAILAFVASIYFLLPRQDEIPLTAQAPVISTEAPTQQEKQVEPATQKEEQAHTKQDKHAQADEKTEPESQRPLPSRERSLPTSSPVMLAGITSGAQLPTIASKPQTIEKRTEFIWVSFMGGEEGDDTLPLQQESPVEQDYVSFASLATSGLERATGLNLSREDGEPAPRRGFWDLAGAGLAGLSQITGTPLYVEKERDDNGRITLFALGDRFRINR